MLTYTYTARNPASGERIKATVEADSEQSASKLIRAEGLVPVEIKVDRSDVGNGLLARFNKVKTKDRVIFSRQLATLLNAGLPLLQSLRNVNNQTTSKPLKIIISKVISDVEAGSPLAKAMGRYPEVFDQVYLSLIAAGEASGTLDKALERLADQQEKDADIVSKVRGAMIYPLIVLFVMAGVVFFMLIKVLPQVKTLYSETKGAQLPLVTEVLLALSDFVVHWWWALLVVIGFGLFFTSRWINSVGGKRLTDKVKMRVWPVGPLFMKMYMARFARTGTTLVASGVPLLQMLSITSHAVNNLYIEDALTKATEKVKAGKSLGAALTNDPNFLPLVPSMLKIGEQSGSMEQMLGKAADYYEKELDNEIKAIQTIIEPVMMIVMGLVAFTIVAAVLLPIYNLASTVGGSV